MKPETRLEQALESWRQGRAALEKTRALAADRYAASILVGTALFLFYFRPFLPYSQRGQFSPRWWPFPVIALISGFLLSLGLGHRRFWVPTSFLLTLFAGNALVILLDSMTGAPEHNLFPIEFLFIAVLASPAYFGASISATVERFRRPAGSKQRDQN